jgi:hypothetical protein
MSDLSCTFVKMALVHALVKVSVELIAIYFHSFEIFHIQIGEMTFCKPDFIMKSNYYFQNAQKGECFLNVFEALVREITLAVNCHFVHIVQHNQAGKIFNL